MGFDDACVRWLLYPLHELVLGRQTVRELGVLRALATGSALDIATDVDRRLSDLLRFAAQNLPYFAERFRDAGVCVNASDPRAELSKLAPISKPEIRKNAERMVFANARRDSIPHSSGGTSGDTLHFRIDRRRQAQTLAARLFMQSRLGVLPGQRRAYLWGSPIERRGNALKPWRDRLLNEILLDAFDLSAASLDRHLERIGAFRPALLYAYPSAAAALAAHARKTGRQRALRSLRAVVLTGEEVAEAERDAIRAAHDCVVVQEYGSREVGLIAHECLRGGLHVLAPHVLVESAPADRFAGPSATGELLCTTLNTRAQPFIRYRVGDAGALLDESCPCGLPLPLMRLDGGKITGFLTLRDGRLCHGAITSHILRHEPGIVQFKTIQRSLDCFDVLLVTDDAFQRTSIDRIRSRYRALLGSAIQIDCSVVEQIAPDPSGKRRYFVSEMAPTPVGAPDSRR